MCSHTSAPKYILVLTHTKKWYHNEINTGFVWKKHCKESTHNKTSYFAVTNIESD